MTYLEWLHSFDEIEDERKAAEAALDDLGRLSARARELLLPIIAEALLMARRNATRTVERSLPVRSAWSGETSVEQRRQRLERTFPVGDGRRVSWLEATVEDHQARIDYLREHIRGVERTIAEHEDAIALIRKFGVSCLAEIPGGAVA